ncbi:hypothetical protein RchiOBHm_Chr7g0197271 [Rosa chinensis]|uniref:Uncharacterized protein n=1 Tax=Rosa chinensis TaxID=74649 RepID=A0A2P6P6T4_ROSCH|nr:hypothetical protein RchiOBHm_Chr7g0197271 [Rosa chinensis]
MLLSDGLFRRCNLTSLVSRLSQGCGHSRCGRTLLILIGSVWVRGGPRGWLLSVLMIVAGRVATGSNHGDGGIHRWWSVCPVGDLDTSWI